MTAGPFWLIYKTHARGFIGLQIHGLSQREVDLPANAGSAITTGSRWDQAWRGQSARRDDFASRNLAKRLDHEFLLSCPYWAFRSSRESPRHTGTLH